MQLRLEFKMCTHNSSALGPPHDLNLPLNICAGTARSSVDLGNRKITFLQSVLFGLLVISLMLMLFPEFRHHLFLDLPPCSKHGHNGVHHIGGTILSFHLPHFVGR